MVSDPSRSASLTVAFITPSALTLICSGRMPRLTTSPTITLPPRNGSATIAPSSTAIWAMSPLTAETFAGTTFILGEPINCATNRFFGRWYSSSGEPTCSIRPALKTTILSAMVIASIWSWVT